MEKMFEAAIRNKYRFPYKGNASVEDLWDLTPKDLDGVFKTLNSQIKVNQEESLLATKSAADTELAAKIEIVKYIVGVKLADAEKAKQAKENKEKKQKLMALIADKQDAELAGKSVAELQAMLAALD